MGYTQYYYKKPKLNKKTWDIFTTDVIQVLEGDPTIAWEHDQPSRLPQVDSKVVRFNGIGEQGHETFYFARNAPQEEINERFAICKECPLFIKNGEEAGVCSHKSCGCNLNLEMVFLNKLGWRREKCPLDKWGPIPE